MTTLYMKATEKQIADYVVFSGDPWRVEVLKDYLEDVEHIAFSREFNTYTGNYKGLRITVTSTGIGAPSAAIAMEEMYACGMKVALRMGTVMSLHDDRLGHFFVPNQSLRQEGTTYAYVDGGVLAKADPDFAEITRKTVEDAGYICHHGLNATMDGFYTHMKTSKLSEERGNDLHARMNALRIQGVDGIDMESAVFFILGQLMQVHTAVLTLATVLEGLKETMEKHARKEAESALCKLALESLWAFSRRNQS